MDVLLPFVAIAIIAFLYSAVGHAGASGYIAVLALVGFAPSEIRPTALVLNILVATLGTVQFSRAGHFRWSLFWPFALLSIPMAFLGGSIVMPARILKMLLAGVLLYSAVRLIARKGDAPSVTPPNRLTALTVGAAIGFLAGITGTGGGIFLTPLLLFRGWATARTAAAASAAFILVNSLAGVAGQVWSGQPMPPAAWFLAAAALIGGGAGAYLGSRRFTPRVIYLLLALVLTIAGTKLLFV